MNVLALVAGCDYTDPRTDPGCYGTGEPTTFTGRAHAAWETTLGQITHPGFGWPDLLGVVFWLLAAAVLVAVVRPLFAGHGTKAVGATAAAAVGGIRGLFAKARTRSESVHVPTVEGEPE